MQHICRAVAPRTPAPHAYGVERMRVRLPVLRSYAHSMSFTWCACHIAGAVRAASSMRQGKACAGLFIFLPRGSFFVRLTVSSPMMRVLRPSM